jgi:hypothetical protein
VKSGSIVNKVFQLQTVGNFIEVLVEVHSFVFSALRVMDNGLDGGDVAPLGMMSEVGDLDDIK